MSTTAAAAAKTATDATGWTLAYRKRGANRFLRVDDLDLTWSQATELGNRLAAAAESKLQVFTVGTRAAEDDGRVPEEDVANILVKSGRRKARVRIKEGGELPAELEPPLSPAEARKVVLGDEDEAPAPAEQPAADAPAQDAPADEPERPAAEQPAGDPHPWTIAYRAPNAKRFRRVQDLSLTRDEVTLLAQRFASKHPEVEVYATWTRQAEEDGLIAKADHGILTTEDGVKIRMVESGVMPQSSGDAPAIRKHKAPKPAAPKPAAPKADAPKPAAPKPAAPKADAPKADAKADAKANAAPKPAPKAKAAPAPTVVDGITVTRVTDGGKRDLVATDANGKIIGRAVGYNDTKPNGAMWFKGWKIMKGKKQIGHVVFQVGVAKAEAKLRELVAA